MGWDKDWFPKKRLRLYFAEPDSRDEIWWLHLAPKSTRGNWYEEQNGHIEEAVERAHDWADRNI
ncbi:hypothetical protein [Flaviflexus huanghaiensis]|uniref:hypothetical protein n=1 Tax=Flaviflexus huanghaiensis TaxID=1111473 RepID=UPI0015FE6A84|nr:hypothetical protein [Flaviflexus huanghaiensis]